MDAEQQIARELGPREWLRWSGRPRQGVFVRGSDVRSTLFGLSFLGFSLYWVWSAWAGGAPPLFVAFGIPFVLIGIRVSVGRFVVDARRRARTSYGVTNRRAIIVLDGGSRTVTALTLSNIADIGVSELSDGSGTITFGGAGLDPDAHVHKFDSIERVQEAYDAILRAQREEERERSVDRDSARAR